MAWEYGSGDLDQAFMRTLMMEDAEVDAMTTIALERVGRARVSGAARDAVVLAHQAQRDRGEILSPVTLFKERLRELLDDRQTH